MRCLKSGSGNTAVYTTVTWRIFYANCPKLNQLCSKFSSGYVAAVTVCNQRLFV